MTDDLAAMDATAQAELVRRRELTPLELVDAAIERIERVNPQLNAVVTLMYDIAREIARRPQPDAPFAGVPFLLKDLTAAYAGVRMTSGSVFLRDYIAPEDSELTARFKRAGFIIVGKTNTPEFGLVPTTEPALFGTTRNPWNVTRTVGGSSGGSGAAVASGMAPAGHANDGGGSIRIPASCCGLFGMKPTRGRNPLAIEPTGLSVEHALTRSVRDSAAILDATQGALASDPQQVAAPAGPYIEECGANPGKLRIGFAKRSMDTTALHPDCVAAVEDAAQLCVELGHDVEEASPEVNEDLLLQAFTVIWAASTAAEIDAWALLSGRIPTEDQFEPLTWALAQRGRTYDAPALLLALMMFQITAQSAARFHETYDVWLTPTLGEPPVPLGTFDAPPDDLLRGWDRAGTFVPMTPLQNATGQPAMSMPLFWNAEGLPIGVHFVGRFGDEATLFRLAAQLEQARPWAQRHPPVFA